jgi:hypothetical protein
MSTSEDRFSSGVVGGDGVWSPPPNTLSHSSLQEMEACPRRWMLKRSRYPDLWEKKGYPELPQVASLVGEIVHGTLELVVKALIEGGCHSPNSAEAVSVLRSLGGYSALISDAIDRIRIQIEDNPRAQDQCSAIIRALQARIPEMRQRTQASLARSRFVPGSAGSGHISSDHGHSEGQLPQGSYPEVELNANSIGWTGRVDLLTLTDNTCQIVDYKTGTAHDEHVEQLNIYALLWLLDTSFNQSQRLATELVLSYPDHDVTLVAPETDDLQQLRQDLELRSQTALVELHSRPPTARPSTENCAWCSVRHLCGEYWQLLADGGSGAISQSIEQRFGDFEIVILERNGTKSWTCDARAGLVLNPDERLIIFPRGQHEEFEPGLELRLLNARLIRDPDERLATLTLGTMSELFRLRA